MKLKKYLTVWWLYSRNSFLNYFYQKTVFFVFLFGKALRFVFYFAFLSLLLGKTNGVGIYSKDTMIVVFLTYSLIDTISQFLFREVYRFRPLVVSGDFDLILVKPINPLFRVLMGGADVIDLVTIPPLLYLTCIYLSHLLLSPFNIFLYCLLLINGLIIAAAFYIMVLGIGIMTLEVDHIVMIYRDLSSMARFPIDIYKKSISFTLYYLLPLGLMITLPVKVLFNLVTPISIVATLAFGVGFLFLSIRFWQFSLTKYTSASS